MGGIKSYFVDWGNLVVSEQYVVTTPGPTGGASFCSWLYPKKMRMQGCDPDFFLFLLLIKGLRKRAGLKISLSNPRVGKILLN